MNFIQKNITALLVVVALASAGSGYYFYHQYQTLKQNPQAITEKENVFPGVRLEIFAALI
jgi:CHASE3 domain sensor protein